MALLSLPSLQRHYFPYTDFSFRPSSSAWDCWKVTCTCKVQCRSAIQASLKGLIPARLRGIQPVGITTLEIFDAGRKASETRSKFNTQDRSKAPREFNSPQLSPHVVVSEKPHAPSRALYAVNGSILARPLSTYTDQLKYHQTTKDKIACPET